MSTCQTSVFEQCRLDVCLFYNCFYNARFAIIFLTSKHSSDTNVK